MDTDTHAFRSKEKAGLWALGRDSSVEAADAIVGKNIGYCAGPGGHGCDCGPIRERFGYLDVIGNGRSVAVRKFETLARRVLRRCKQHRRYQAETLQAGQIWRRREDAAQRE